VKRQPLTALNKRGSQKPVTMTRLDTIQRRGTN
jgi:hypothetical protein